MSSKSVQRPPYIECNSVHQPSYKKGCFRRTSLHTASPIYTVLSPNPPPLLQPYTTRDGCDIIIDIPSCSLLQYDDNKAAQTLALLSSTATPYIAPVTTTVTTTPPPLPSFSELCFNNPLSVCRYQHIPSPHTTPLPPLKSILSSHLSRPPPLRTFVRPTPSRLMLNPPTPIFLASEKSTPKKKKYPYGVFRTVKSTSQRIPVFLIDAIDRQCHLYSHNRICKSKFPDPITGLVTGKKIKEVLTDSSLYFIALETFEGELCPSGNISITLVVDAPQKSMKNKSISNKHPRQADRVYNCVPMTTTRGYNVGCGGSGCDESNFFNITSNDDSGVHETNSMIHQYTTPTGGYHISKTSQKSIFKVFSSPIEIKINADRTTPISVIVQVGEHNWVGKFKIRRNQSKK